MERMLFEHTVLCMYLCGVHKRLAQAIEQAAVILLRRFEHTA
jgi:hypothetical protein